MSSYFFLTLDTKPPGNPALVIAGGAGKTGQRDVLVSVFTADYQEGSRDVDLMRLWGDVDPAADPLVQAAEAESAWVPYAPTTAVRLSEGSGVKRVYARLRDDVCNETVVFTDSIELDLTSPQVVITTPVDNSRISKVAPCHEVSFEWTCNRPFVAYEVKVVPSTGSPRAAGVVLGGTHGSVNTAGTGGWSADSSITTVVRGADLEVASPGNTAKVVKVYVRDADGRWSA